MQSNDNYGGMTTSQNLKVYKKPDRLILLSCILVIVCLISMFFNWINIADSSIMGTTVKSEITDGTASYQRQLDDMDNEDIADLQDELDDTGIKSVSAKQLMKDVQRVVKTISDGGISPWEAARCSSAIRHITKVLKNDTISGSDTVLVLLTSSLKSLKNGIMFLSFIFWITIITGIATIIMRLSGKSPIAGYIHGGLSLIICLSFLIISGKINTAVTDLASLASGMASDILGNTMNLNTGKIVQTSFWLYLCAIAAIGSVLSYWLSKKNQTVIVPMAVEIKKPVLYCSNCHEPLEEGNKFCKKCGTPVSQVSSQNQQFCSNCGKPVSNDSKFCAFCGTPTSNQP